MSYNQLTTEEKYVIEDKGTERAFTGEYDDFYKDGTYVCRRCNTPLFSAAAKYDAGCGWPAFDDNFPGAVKRIPDADGSRTEIQCSHCGGHLGHVFEGEKLTAKDTRHCVNSLSIKFIPKDQEMPEVSASE
jgi:peptide-methionine (R)-S-oxide reductase